MELPDFYQFIERTKPLIEQAAQNAQRRAKRVIANVHLLHQIYQQERDRLHFAAWDFRDNETVQPDRHSTYMTPEEFQAYLLNRAVWVETDEDDETGSAAQS